jgi:membrane protein involved in colicin uptake
MSISFKQFATYLDRAPAAEEAGQLDELFGKIFGKAEDKEKKQEKLTDAQKALQAKKEAEAKRKAEMRARNDAAWKAAKDRAEGRSAFDSERGSMTMRSQAATGRAAERDWVDNL